MLEINPLAINELCILYNKTQLLLIVFREISFAAVLCLSYHSFVHSFIFFTNHFILILDGSRARSGTLIVRQRQGTRHTHSHIAAI